MTAIAPTAGAPVAPAPGPLPRPTARLLLLTAALLPLKVGSGGPLAPADAAVLLTAGSLLPHVPRLPAAARAACLTLLAALTVAGFVTFFGPDVHAARWGAVRLVGYGLLLVYLATFHHAVRGRPAVAGRVLRTLVVATTAVNVALLPGLPTRPLLAVVFHQKWESRLSGALFDPNANGAVLAVCLILVLFGPRSVLPGGRWRWITAAALAACLAWTFSRGAAAGAAVGVGYGFLVAVGRRPHRLLPVLLGMAAAAALVVASGAPDVVAERYEQRPQSSFDNRVGYVESSLDAFVGHPLTGAGLGHGTSTEGAVTHATFFWLLGDAGIIAALSYAGLLVAAVVAARRVAGPLRTALVGSLLCLTVTSFSFESLYQRPLWVVLAVAFGLGPVRPRERATIGDAGGAR